MAIKSELWDGTWSFTMDAELHLTIFRGRTIAWEGSYEAFVADGDIAPPLAVTERIHDRHDAMSERRPRCPDCGLPGETKGHQTCQYPQD